MATVFIELGQKWLIEPPRFGRILIPAQRREDRALVALWLDKARVRGYWMHGLLAYVEYETDNAQFYLEKVSSKEALPTDARRARLASWPRDEEGDILVFSRDARAKNFSRTVTVYSEDLGDFVPPLYVEEVKAFITTNVHPELGVLD